MTTTTKSQNGKQQTTAPKVEVTGEWEDAATARGGAERAQWAPHMLVEGFKDEVIAEKIAGLPDGSFADKFVVGTLIVEEAFGEPRYFIKWETKGDRNGEIISLPMHGAVTHALDRVALEPAPRVRIEITGKAKRGKAGQNAPFTYDLRVLPKSAMLTTARDGKDKTHGGYPALAPIHKTNKAERDARNVPVDPRGDD